MTANRIELLYRKATKQWAPPVRMTVARWAETRRRLASSAAATPGRFRLSRTPYLREPLEIIGRMTPASRAVRELCGQKSAQVGWTDGVICNTLGWMIDIDPTPTIVMFPRDKTARDFNLEKFEPMVEVTECLQSKVPTKSRSKETTQDRKTFPGGFIKLVGANSTGGVKSTPARLLIVEEPDDCNKNLKGQGDSISLLRERGKTFPDALMLIGGTPTLEGLSAIESEMELSDKRRWYVPCHHCGHEQHLEWENVRCTEDASIQHPVYGSTVPVSARYFCASCGGAWADAEKNRNVSRGRWIATAPFSGIAGYYFNELMSPFPLSRLEELVRKHLAAKHELEKGNVGPMIAFWNGTLGRTWRWQSGAPEKSVLVERAEDYELLTVPWGGLVITMGIDVQGDRLAVLVRAWGRGEESWLLWWGEILGNPVDKSDGCWTELDDLLFRTYRHASGADLGVWAAGIDSSDGNTSDAVYDYVRSRKLKIRRGELPRVMLMAIKGSTVESKEIFSRPGPSMEATRAHTKVQRYGLRSYMVGVSRAKDLIIGTAEGGGRIKLVGRGPGRMHCTRQVRGDYWDQVLAEVKAPDPRSYKRKLSWQKKAGARNEALDCEVYALHGCKAVGLERWSEARWVEMEKRLLQATLFDEQPAQGTDDDEEVGVQAGAAKEDETGPGSRSEEAEGGLTRTPSAESDAVPEAAVHTSAPKHKPAPGVPAIVGGGRFVARPGGMVPI
jgi:phage terminase large subunit GpA-like protein